VTGTCRGVERLPGHERVIADRNQAVLATAIPTICLLINRVQCAAFASSEMRECQHPTRTQRECFVNLVRKISKTGGVEMKRVNAMAITATADPGHPPMAVAKFTSGSMTDPVLVAVN